jgi:hypothetical protein
MHSRTCNIWILMCRGGVGSILVMFDMLDYYILYMCLLLFVYYIVYLFWRLPDRGGRQNRIFFKKILIFVGFLTNIRATWGRRGWSGLPRDCYVHRKTNEHKANVSPGWLWDYMACVRRPGGTDKHKCLIFVGST